MLLTNELDNSEKLWNFIHKRGKKSLKESV